MARAAAALALVGIAVAGLLGTNAPLSARDGLPLPAARRDLPIEAIRMTSSGPTLVPFDNSPFPFQGMIPEQDKPFLERDPDGRMFHLAPRAGKLYEATYADRRSLLYAPPRFDPHRPDAALILFFHGNLATLADVAGRQRVPQQLLASRMNAALVAPQLAVRALDSSPGKFWNVGFLDTYLAEAAQRLADLSGGRFAANDIARLPVVIVAYSGGYLATAFTLKYSPDTSRIRGVVLLDALFGEEPKFARWIARAHGSAFFVSAFSKASEALNVELEHEMAAAGILVETAIPAQISPGRVVFQAAPDAVHNDFVTAAWTRDPLAQVLSRIHLSAP